ncbi:hypothetical protein [Streptomyces sp. NPDC060184]|uniref:hypothetical protein n=1 Tax=Streptomyces sp. NPDC060184 TaxID=3347064 RepID=UPI003665421A
MALLTTCALLFAALAAVLAMATQAHAFSTVGSLTLTPASGKIDDPLIASRAGTDGPCPAGSVGAPSLMVVLPGQDGAGLKLANFTNDAATTTDGPFAGDLKTAVPAVLHRTLGQRLLQAIPEGSFDGVYTVGLTCESSAADAPAFTALIEVEGDSWSVLEQKATTVTLSSVPENPVVGADYTLVTTVVPQGADGRITLASMAGVNTEPVTIAEKDTTDGKAEFTLTAPSTPGAVYFRTTFTPTDVQQYGPSVTDGQVVAVGAATTPPPTTPAPGGPEDLVVTDSEGNILEADPSLEPGDAVKITAHGFAAAATVKADLDGGTALTDATADAEGTVTDYAFTVPDDIEDGTHTLTLAEEATGGHTVDFAFTTGAAPTDDPTDPAESPTADPSDTTSPDASTGGSDTGGSGSGGSDSGGLGTDSGSGGGTLASTGAQLGTAALGGLALIAAGAALVVHGRRKGMLHFGTPRH